MEIGEITSEDLGEIIEKSRVLERNFKTYCRQHNKFFHSHMFLGPGLIILKCYLAENENS